MTEKTYNGMSVMRYGQYDAVMIKDHHLADKNGFVYLHRLVAEEMLGRPLKRTESVHHIDENKRNNTKENLMVFKTVADHSGFHSGIKAEKDGDVWITKRARRTCIDCGSPIWSGSTRCKKCSNRYIARKRHIKTDRDLGALKLLWYSGWSKEAIGRCYGVSGNAVKKWIIKYGL